MSTVPIDWKTIACVITAVWGVTLTLGVATLLRAASREAPRPKGPMVFSNRCPSCGAIYARRVEPEELHWARTAAEVAASTRSRETYFRDVAGDAGSPGYSIPHERDDLPPCPPPLF